MNGTAVDSTSATSMLHQGKPSRNPASLLILIIVLIIFGADEAAALQTHNGSEGIVVHQFAHFQYGAALLYLLWDIRRSAFTGTGWKYLQRFCWLMVLWNILTFAGHFAQVSLPEQDISMDDGYLSAFLLLPLTFGKWIYYIAALDHLISVPALFCLFLAMRTFYFSAEAHKEAK